MGFCCEKFQKLGIIWHQNDNFHEKMRAIGDRTQFCVNMGSLGEIGKNMGSFG